MPLRSFTQAEIALTQRRRMEIPLLAMIWLSIVTFTIAEYGWFHLLTATVCVGLNLYAVLRAKEIFVHPTAVKITAVVAMALLILEMLASPLGGESFILALGHCLTLLLICKLFDRKFNRDYMTMLALSLLLMIAATSIGIRLLVAVGLLIYVILACYTAMVFCLKRGLDASASSRLSGEAAPPGVQEVAWSVTRHWPGGALRRSLAVVLVFVFAGGAIAFVTIPRMPKLVSDIWVPTSIKGATTSLGTGEIKLGNAQRIELSDSIVMRVKITSAAGADAPLDSAAYLRGMSFDIYRESSWENQFGEGHSRRRIFPSPPQELLEGSHSLDVKMSALLLPKVFTPYPTISANSPAGEIYLNNRREVRLLKDSGEMSIEYTARFWPQPLDGTKRKHLREYSSFVERAPGWQRRIQVHPMVDSLARQWCDDLLAKREQQPELRDRIDRMIAERIASKLRQRCRYTTNLIGADPSRDGVVDFLFHMKRGHCEYFASALTVMCAALDVRARLSVGFAIDQSDRRNGWYVVRERHAHAWTEVFTPTSDWVIVEATPGGAPAIDFSWSERLVLMAGRIERTWYNTVVMYDSTDRKAIWGWVASKFRSLGDVMASAARALWEGFMNLLISGYIDEALLRFMIVIGAVGLVLEIVVIFRIVRTHRRAKLMQQRLYGVGRGELGFIRSLMALLSRHGLELGPTTTPMELARQAAATLDLPAEALAEVIALYYRLRWGKMAPQPGEIQRAQQQVSRLEQMI